MATMSLNQVADWSTTYQRGKRIRKVVVSILCILIVSLSETVLADGYRGGVREALGQRFTTAANTATVSIRPQHHGSGLLARLRYWNQIAINCSGLDHTPVPAGESRVFGEQLGPGRASRAMAIVHIAMFDAINAIAGGYRSYTGVSSLAGSPSSHGRSHCASGARYTYRPVSLAASDLGPAAR